MNRSEIFSSTRVLVELGKSDPHLVFPAFEKALLQSDIASFDLAMFELSELGKFRTQEVIAFFESILQKFYPYSFRYESIRILVNVGQKYPDKVVHILEKALSSADVKLLQASIYEITMLAEIHPTIFIPLLEHSLDHHNPHIQWITVLSLLHLAKIHPHHIAALLKKYLEDMNFIPPHKSNAHIRSKNAIKNYQAILQKGKNNNKQWNAILKITELADSDAELTIPILEQALMCHDVHIKWIAALTLIKSTLQQPESICDIFNTVYKSQKNTNRVLFQLYPPLPCYIKKIFSYALCSNNLDLKITTLYELFRIFIKNSYKPKDFILILNEVFKKNEIYKEHIKNNRLLVNLNKNQPGIVKNIFHIALTVDKNNLLSATEKELCAIQ